MESDVITINAGRSDGSYCRTFVFWKGGLRNDEEAEKMIDYIDTNIDADVDNKKPKKFELNIKRYKEITGE